MISISRLLNCPRLAPDFWFQISNSYLLLLQMNGFFAPFLPLHSYIFCPQESQALSYVGQTDPCLQNCFQGIAHVRWDT